MNSIKQSIIAALLLNLILIGFSGCGSDDTTGEVEPLNEGYVGMWKVTGASINGFDVTSDYQGANVTIRRDENDPDVYLFFTSYDSNPKPKEFLPIGSTRFSVTSGDDSSIIFQESQVPAVMKIVGTENNTLELSFTLDGHESARTQGIEGNWLFTLTKN